MQTRMSALINKLNQLAKRKGFSVSGGGKPALIETLAAPDESGYDPSPEIRREIAFRYLSGEGIEIGALHSPLEVPDTARVRYMDRMPVEQLREQYPELCDLDLVDVEIVGDGELLETVKDSSLDFLIANHMIEHCQNPLEAIRNYMRVLKIGGVIYMAVPDKRHTFDRDRPNTTIEHLARDYGEGPQWSRRGHFEEYARLVDKVPESEMEAKTARLIDIDYSIHFHVWTPADFMEMLLYFRNKIAQELEVELFRKNGMESIFILRKAGRPS